MYNKQRRLWFKEVNIYYMKSLQEWKYIFETVCPLGQSWAAACTEGLVLYSLESDIVFDPFQLDCDITPDKILQASINKEHTKALVMSLRINELGLVCQVMEEVEPRDSKCHLSLFYQRDEKYYCIYKLNLAIKNWPGFSPRRLHFFWWVCYLHVVVCPLAKINLGIWNSKQYSVSK